MAEENITPGSVGGEVADKSSVIAEAPAAEKAGTSAPANEGGKETAGEGNRGAGNVEYTRAFKERIDRIRNRERAIYEEAQKKRDAEWQRKFDELNAKYDSLKPKGIRREDYASDEDFVAAKRKDAADALKREWEAEAKAKADKEAEEKRKSDEATEYQRKFAERFNARMGETMTEAMQRDVARIVNDPYGDVNTALVSPEGETLKKWLMEDSENPAAAVLYLERNPEKLKNLLKASPRRQVQSLDGLEMLLEKSRRETLNKAKTAAPAEEKAKAPVIGKFGGSSAGIADESALSDQERVARLIKAMRTR